MAKVIFVNIKLKYLFLKVYEDNRELIKLLIKLYHTPQPPILPVLIEGQNGIDSDSRTIKYWFTSLGAKLMPHYYEYLSYPMYEPKNNKNK